MIREANKDDLNALLELYLCLHEDSIPGESEHLRRTWEQIINDPNHHLIVNVVTHKDYRCRGLAQAYYVLKDKKIKEIKVWVDET